MFVCVRMQRMCHVIMAGMCISAWCWNCTEEGGEMYCMTLEKEPGRDLEARPQIWGSF